MVDNRTSRESSNPSRLQWAAYTAPFLLYLVLTALAAEFGAWYPAAYAAVVVVTSAAAAWLLWREPVVKPHGRVASAVAVGLAGIALWIPLSQWQLEQYLRPYLPSVLAPGERPAFNPFEELPLGCAWAFVAVRCWGLVVVVPLAEELFWRGFLWRWIIDPNWERVPLGQYHGKALLLVTLMFTLAHPEWLAAVVYVTLLNLYFLWRRDLWGCIVAHSVSNAVLAAYVLLFEAWALW